MLEGDVPQEHMTKHIKIGCLFSFVKKVSENLGTLWGWQKQSQTQYNGGTRWQGRAQLSRTLAPQTR